MRQEPGGDPGLSASSHSHPHSHPHFPRIVSYSVNVRQHRGPALTTAATFDKVEKTYKTGLFGRGGVAAVRGVTLTVPAGGVFGLLGPNRAGKTTLVKLLLSLSAPSAGTVTRLGQPLDQRSTLGRV